MDNLSTNIQGGILNLVQGGQRPNLMKEGGVRILGHFDCIQGDASLLSDDFPSINYCIMCPGGIKLHFNKVSRGSDGVPNYVLQAWRNNELIKDCPEGGG